jgi:hypothetical protein
MCGLYLEQMLMDYEIQSACENARGIEETALARGRIRGSLERVTRRKSDGIMKRTHDARVTEQRKEQGTSNTIFILFICCRIV